MFTFRFSGQPVKTTAWFEAGFIPCLVALFLVVGNLTTAQAQSVGNNCGELRPEGQYGPYDSRTDRSKLPIVLGAHFTPKVEALISGQTTERPGGDIDYTLRAIPNNHRALMSMMRLGEKEKTLQPSGSRFTVSCWFERAILFAPDDAIVRMIYSSYLHSKGAAKEVAAQMEFAKFHAKDNPFTHYNIGLHYFDFKNYGQALAQAHKAMALGFVRTALRDQLAAAGKWAEPVAPTVPSDPAPATPPASPASEIEPPAPAASTPAGSLK